MAKIDCKQVTRCAWPDCECSWAQPTRFDGSHEKGYGPLWPNGDSGRGDLPADEDINPVVAAALAATKPAPKLMQFVSTIHKTGPLLPGEIMYQGTKHQKADPSMMRAVVESQFGLRSDDGERHIKSSQPLARKVIPINLAQDAPQVETKFDADILAIMLHEMGTDRTADGRGFIVRNKDLAKLAEALNNLAP